MAFRIYEEGALEPDETDIPEGLYREALRQKDFISTLNAIELKFEILHLNFVDFERHNFENAFKTLTRFEIDRSVIHDLHSSTNQRVNNFLSSVRLYNDQRDRELKHFAYPELLSRADVKHIFSGIYDAHLEYRVGEFLRDYAQHRSLPVKSISSQWKRIDSEVLSFGGRNTFDPTLSLAALCDDPRMKDDLKTQLQALGCDLMDLKYLIRRYYSFIAEGHAGIRAMTDEAFKVAVAFFRKDVWPVWLSVERRAIRTTFPG